MIEPDLDLEVRGRPQTAGSKTAYPYIRGRGPNGKPILGVRVVEGKHSQEKAKQLWRDTVSTAVLERLFAVPTPALLDGPLFGFFEFWLPRPKTVAAPFPTAPPDTSKLVRAFEDPLVRPVKPIRGEPRMRGLLKDDSRIVLGLAGKLFADDHPPGARARIWHLERRPSVDELVDSFAGEMALL